MGQRVQQREHGTHALGGGACTGLCMWPSQVYYTRLVVRVCGGSKPQAGGSAGRVCGHAASAGLCATPPPTARHAPPWPVVARRRHRVPGRGPVPELHACQRRRHLLGHQVASPLLPHELGAGTQLRRQAATKAGRQAGEPRRLFLLAFFLGAGARGGGVAAGMPAASLVAPCATWPGYGGRHSARRCGMRLQAVVVLVVCVVPGPAASSTCRPPHPEAPTPHYHYPLRLCTCRCPSRPAFCFSCPPVVPSCPP